LGTCWWITVYVGKELGVVIQECVCVCVCVCVYCMVSTEVLLVIL